MSVARATPTAPVKRQRGRKAPVTLASELYLMYRLLRELLRRLTGVPAGSSVLATTFAFGVLANALRRIAAPTLRAFRPRPLSLAGMLFVVAVPVALLRRITGARSTDSLLVGSTVAVSLAVPALKAGAASARAASGAVAALGRMAIGKPAGR
jgi:hypothetical protein